MTSYVVTEGTMDASLVERVLALAGTREVKVLAARGRSSATSLARSLLANARGRVALLLDSDASDAAAVARQRSDLEALLALVGPSSKFRLVLMVPELETILLRDDVLMGAGQPRLDEGDRQLAQFEPKNVLERLLKGESRQEFVEGLPPAALERIASTPEFRSLLEFLEDGRESESAA